MVQRRERNDGRSVRKGGFNEAAPVMVQRPVGPRTTCFYRVELQ